MNVFANNVEVDNDEYVIYELQHLAFVLCNKEKTVKVNICSKEKTQSRGGRRHRA